MKKTTTSILILMILFSGLASAVDFEINYTTSTNTYRSSGSFSNIQVRQLRYEPYPANPGDYVTIWIKAENIGNDMTEDATFELIPKFPFSLDSNEDPIRKYGQLPSEEPVVLEYKVRVDEDAVSGTNEIELRYNSDGEDSSWIYKDFDIEIDDAQTDFDLVVQDITDDESSFAIANIGENVAYSVIVKIPEQESYQAIGTDGQMVGNLEDGDYTLVAFEIQNKVRSTEDHLKIQIDYTDEIGVRRSILKEVKFNTESSGLNNSMMSKGTLRNGMMMQQTEKAIYQEWWFWTIAIIVLYISSKSIKWISRKKEEKEEKNHKKK